MNYYIKQNQHLWDKWTQIHTTISTASYDIESFVNGATTLSSIEIEELGDICNKSLLHLQCHFGLDTLSLIRDKGCIATGIDLSSEAIHYAKNLSNKCNIQARFICSDIYDLPLKLNKKFDIVFTSYGVLTWLNDIDKWAEIVAHYLNPGGIFYIVEFHPYTHMFDTTWQNITEPYFYNSKEPIKTEEYGSYADRNNEFTAIAYEWPHTLGEIISALCKAGLIIEFLHEFPYSPFNCFPNLEEIRNGEYKIQGKNIDIPLTYSIRAYKNL